MKCNQLKRYDDPAHVRWSVNEERAEMEKNERRRRQYIYCQRAKERKPLFEENGEDEK